MSIERKRALAVLAVVLLVGVCTFRDRFAEAVSGVVWRVGSCTALGLAYLGNHASTVAALVSIIGLCVNFTFQYLNYKRAQAQTQKEV